MSSAGPPGKPWGLLRLRKLPMRSGLRGLRPGAYNRAMSRLRPLLTFCLALAVAVTSLTMAVARGQAMPVGEMVICSGYGVTSVSVDAEGKPVGVLHPCPKCLSALALWLAPAPPGALPAPAGESRLAPVAPATLFASADPASPRARSPPVLRI